MANKKTDCSETFYKSDCGKYICRDTGGCNFEAWTVDGCFHWRNDNRVRTLGDLPTYVHPMVYAVGGYSGERTGQREGSFTLTLLHCDPSKTIEPYKGNTIIESLDAVFRRKVPMQHVPHWLKEKK
jgi:hypothetical protein